MVSTPWNLLHSILHSQLRRSGLALSPDVVQRADVRMRELRDRLCLPLEALPEFGRRAERYEESTLIATVRSSRVSRAR